jgi:hypothetical protein
VLHEEIQDVTILRLRWNRGLGSTMADVEISYDYKLGWYVMAHRNGFETNGIIQGRLSLS